MIDDNREVEFLIDTGASICTLKEKAVKNKNKLNQNDKTKIVGISGHIETLGMCINQLNFNGLKVNYGFHIVDNDFPVLVEGILGANFLMDHGAKINLGKFVL